jgi:hypothetical protein
VNGYCSIFDFCVATDLFGASSRTCTVTVADNEVTVLGQSQCTAYFLNSNFPTSVQFPFWPSLPKFCFCSNSMRLDV